LGWAAGVSAIGVWAAGQSPPCISAARIPHTSVIDEVAGQLVTYLGTGVGWKGAIIGFLLFRGLDIVKPWPANRLEALHGGLGYRGRRTSWPRCTDVPCFMCSYGCARVR
jgi:phosphatidylglycerophosphatase A